MEAAPSAAADDAGALTYTPLSAVIWVVLPDCKGTASKTSSRPLTGGALAAGTLVVDGSAAVGTGIGTGGIIHGAEGTSADVVGTVAFTYGREAGGRTDSCGRYNCSTLGAMW